MRLGFFLGLLLGIVAVYLLTAPAQGASYVVNLNTTTGITEAQVRGWLNDAGYEPLTLLARVDVVDSGLVVSNVGCGSFGDPPSGFFALPAAIQFNSLGLLVHPHLDASHEYGHVWSQYHRCVNWGNSFDPYLIARGIYNSPWLDFIAPTCRNPVELMAHDYEQLFGNINDGPGVYYASCAQQEQGVGLQEPYNVPGFRDWYALTFTQGHPPPGYGGATATPVPPAATATRTPTPTLTSPTATRTPPPVGTCFPPKARRCR